VIIYNAVFLRSCAPDIIVTPGERRLSVAALRPAEREATSFLSLHFQSRDASPAGSDRRYAGSLARRGETG